MAWRVVIDNQIPIGEEYTATITNDDGSSSAPPMVVVKDDSTALAIDCPYDTSHARGGDTVWPLGTWRTGYGARLCTVNAVLEGGDEASDTKQIEDGDPGGGGGRGSDRRAVLVDRKRIPAKLWKLLHKKPFRGPIPRTGANKKKALKRK